MGKALRNDNIGDMICCIYVYMPLINHKRIVNCPSETPTSNS